MPDTARPAPRHILGLLRGTSAVAALVHEIDRREVLLGQVRSLLPEALRDRCRQAACRDGLLVLSVESPAWVSRLRFYSPQLIEALGRLGVHADDCHVHALPDRVFVSPQQSAPRSVISSTAADHLTEAARCVSDDALARSLTRLAERFRNPS